MDDLSCLGLSSYTVKAKGTKSDRLDPGGLSLIGCPSLAQMVPSRGLMKSVMGGAVRGQADGSLQPGFLAGLFPSKIGVCELEF